MTYADVKKINPTFDVPEDAFNDHFEAFEKSYSGQIENHAGKFNCESWRAFEIGYRSGEIGRQKKNSETTGKSDKARFGRRGKSASDRSGQIRPDSDGDAENDSQS